MPLGRAYLQCLGRVRPLQLRSRWLFDQRQDTTGAIHDDRTLFNRRSNALFITKCSKLVVQLRRNRGKMLLDLSSQIGELRAHLQQSATLTCLSVGPLA